MKKLTIIVAILLTCASFSKAEILSFGDITAPSSLSPSVSCAGSDVAIDSPTFVIDCTNGLVGIGTPDPSAKLSILSDQAAASYVLQVSSQDASNIFGIKGDGSVVINDTLDASGAVTFNSTLDVDGNIVAGAAGYRSTFTAASGILNVTGAITSLGALNGAFLAISGGANVGVFTVDSASGTVEGDFLATGIFYAGTGPTTLTNAVGKILAASIADGSLGSGVIASSLAVNSVYTASIVDLTVTDAKINDVAPGKVSAGALDGDVVASSIAVNGVYPAAVIAGTYGNITLPAANVAAGSLGGSVITSSVAVGIIGTPNFTVDANAPTASALAANGANCNPAVDGLAIGVSAAGVGECSTNGAALTTLTAANISAGSLGGSVIASSIAVNGVYPEAVAAGTYSNITLPAGNVAGGSLGGSVIASSITLASMYGSPTLDAANITGLPAASVLAGSLGGSVIASSITLAAMYGAPTLTGTNFTSLPGAQVGSGVPAANIAAGSLGSEVIASSVTAASIYTGAGLGAATVPDAALQANVALLNRANQTFSGVNTYSSSITVKSASLFSNGDMTIADPDASSNSPSLILSGNAEATNEQASIQLIQGTDPYLRFSVDDSSGTNELKAVFDMKDTGLFFTTDNVVDIGGAADNRPKNIYAAGTITAGSGFSGSGASLTSLPGAQVGSGVPAANIAAGSLGAGVIASSVAVDSVYTAAIAALAVTDAKINDVAPGKVSAGSLDSDVIASSIAVAAVGIPNINATGSPGETTYLAGNGTWATPAGAGDAVLANDQTFSGKNTFTSSATFTASGAATFSVGTSSGISAGGPIALWNGSAPGNGYLGYTQTGNVLSVSSNVIDMGAWVNYTPSFGNFTLDAGTINYARYQRIGRLVHVEVKVTLNSSDMGTGPTISLPVTASARYAAGDVLNGYVFIDDTGTAGYAGYPMIASSTTVEFQYLGAAGSLVTRNQISATTPMTWANTDVFRVVFAYEAE